MYSLEMIHIVNRRRRHRKRIPIDIHVILGTHDIGPSLSDTHTNTHTPTHTHTHAHTHTTRTHTHMGVGGALIDTTPFDRRVVGSNAALTLCKSFSCSCLKR